MTTRLLSTVAALGVLVPQAARAAEDVWQGGVDQNWFTSGNWVGGVPTGADDARIDAGPEAQLSGGAASVSNLLVGGPGSLSVGGALTSRDAIIDGTGASAGLVTLYGSAGVWDTGTLRLGRSGSGKLDVTTAARFLGGRVVLGEGATGNGTLSVSGGGSRLETQATTIGLAGTGSLEVVAGATARTGDLDVAAGGGSAGTLKVAGGGSSLDVDGRLDLGVAGSGTLELSTGALLTSDAARLGTLAGADGAALVTGAGTSWTNAGALTVGDAGRGTLEIYSGAGVSSASATVGTTAQGTVRIGGLGSLWTSGNLTLGGGAGGAGELHVAASGRLESDAASLGGAAGSRGLATVDGGSSIWDLSSRLTLGASGQGTLTVSNAGTVRSAGGTLGAAAGSAGQATVTGGGSLWAAGSDLGIGAAGTGALLVSAGAQVQAGAVVLGARNGGAGRATVLGTGSSLASAGTITIGEAGSGTLRLADGGTASATEFVIARDAGSSGSLIVGSDIGQTAAGYGSFSANAIRFGAGDGDLVFNFGGPVLTYGGTISGNGAITVADGRVVLAGNNSTFTGLTTLSGGSLLVEGSLGGTLVVTAGTLGGTGQLGSLDVAAGAQISPGAAASSQRARTGDVSFAAGSRFLVEIDPAAGTGGRIAADGTATLSGGDVVVSGPAIGFGATRSFTILTADNGVTGRFDDVSTTFAFLDPSLSYGAQDVTLQLSRNAVGFADVAVNRNGRAAARAVQSIGSGGALYDTFEALSVDEAREALGQLAGDLHGSTGTAFLDHSRYLRGLALQRDRAAGAGPRAVSPLAYGEKEPSPAAAATNAALAAPADKGLTLWAEGFGGWSDLGGRGGAADLDATTGGLAMGIEAPSSSSGWRLGLLGAYGRTDMDLAGNRGSADSDDWSIGLHGGRNWGALGLSLGAIYTYHDISTERRVAFGNIDQNLRSDYDAQSTQAFGELGYEIALGAAAWIEPFANLAYVHLRQDGFRERGGSAALTGSASGSDTGFSTIGLRSGTDFTLAGVPVFVEGSLGWRHAYGERIGRTTLSFAGSDSFTSLGTAIAADALAAEAGFGVNLGANTAVKASYGGDYGGDSSSQLFRLRFSSGF